jgi:hypothetical protein
MSGSADLQLPLRFHGRDARLRVTPCDNGEWNVSVAVDGREIIRTHCSTWQRVELLRARLQADHEVATASGACRTALAGALLVGILLGAAGLAAQPLDEVTAAFDARVADYLALRERLRAAIMPEHIVDPHIRDISGALLAARIREARRAAAAGEVFTAEMSERIRDNLHQSVDGTSVDALLADAYPRGLPASDTAQLSASYAHTIAIRPPAAVLTVLPRVPMTELGYRLIGRDLVLWDEEAALVVDIVFEALPAPRVWPFLAISSMALRACIARALAAAHLDGQALVEDMISDTRAGAGAPAVGQPFSWDLGTSMPPSVLHALPSLPSSLEYRFVLTDLVVIDTATNIVVGVMHDALPRPAQRRIT